jgi:hypothetical protein
MPIITDSEGMFFKSGRMMALRMFGNSVLRRLLGPKREEVAGGWRTLHNEELYNLYASPDYHDDKLMGMR